MGSLDDRFKSQDMSLHDENGDSVRDYAAARNLKNLLLAELRTSWDEDQSRTSEDNGSLANPVAEAGTGNGQHCRVDQQRLPEEHARRLPAQPDSHALPAAGDEVFGFRL